MKKRDFLKTLVAASTGLVLPWQIEGQPTVDDVVEQFDVPKQLPGEFVNVLRMMNENDKKFYTLLHLNFCEIIMPNQTWFHDHTGNAYAYEPKWLKMGVQLSGELRKVIGSNDGSRMMISGYQCADWVYDFIADKYVTHEPMLVCLHTYGKSFSGDAVVTSLCFAVCENGLIQINVGLAFDQLQMSI